MEPCLRPRTVAVFASMVGWLGLANGFASVPTDERTIGMGNKSINIMGGKEWGCRRGIGNALD
jgi:hypothetical protein